MLRFRLFRVAAAAALLLAASAATADPTPSLWDPGLHLDNPELGALKSLRFLTADDYPPFDFALANGELAGFNIEIARAVCAELAVACTIQPRRWDTLVEALNEGKGDAIIASMRSSPALRERLSFTGPYYLTPGRFAARKTLAPIEITPASLANQTVGVIKGSTHAAYLATFFPRARARTYDDFAALHRALKNSDVDLVFADGVTLAVWLGGEDAADCCEYRGGPYLDSRAFGEGVGIAVRRQDEPLRRALDWALARVWASGTYVEIYRKYFPVPFY